MQLADLLRQVKTCVMTGDNPEFERHRAWVRGKYSNFACLTKIEHEILMLTLDFFVCSRMDGPFIVKGLPLLSTSEFREKSISAYTWQAEGYDIVPKKVFLDDKVSDFFRLIQVFKMGFFVAPAYKFVLGASTNKPARCQSDMDFKEVALWINGAKILPQYNSSCSFLGGFEG